MPANRPKGFKNPYKVGPDYQFEKMDANGYAGICNPKECQGDVYESGFDAALSSAVHTEHNRWDEPKALIFPIPPHTTVYVIQIPDGEV